jgi:hypothetical protein
LKFTAAAQTALGDGDMTDRSSRCLRACTDSSGLFDDGGSDQSYFRTDTIRVQNIHSRELEEDIAKLFVVSSSWVEQAMPRTMSAIVFKTRRESCFVLHVE